MVISLQWESEVYPSNLTTCSALIWLYTDAAELINNASDCVLLLFSLHNYQIQVAHFWVHVSSRVSRATCRENMFVPRCLTGFTFSSADFTPLIWRKCSTGEMLAQHWGMSHGSNFTTHTIALYLNKALKEKFLKQDVGIEFFLKHKKDTKQHPYKITQVQRKWPRTD